MDKRLDEACRLLKAKIALGMRPLSNKELERKFAPAWVLMSKTSAQKRK